MKYERLLKKAERLLKANVYYETDYLWGKYRMISPAKNWFTGIWNWDSAFHAIGMIPYDIEIAKEQILGFFQFQREDGRLVDAVNEKGEIIDLCTKPPVMAYAAWRVYDACKDNDFAAEIYLKLCKEIEFWERERQYEGMFHYDADKSRISDDEEYRKWVGNDSGWDNSPRWDKEPQNFWAIDLNCYVVMAYRALEKMAEALGFDGKVWRDKADELADKINSKLWNKELMSYTDCNFATNEHSNVLTPASFMPLFAEIATEDRAKAMESIAKQHFLPGMPTVAYTSSEYDDKNERAYWRGPCWLNVAYFAAKGLKKYGFDEVADEIRETILTWVDNDGDCIHENYNATTGKGLRIDHFSWSCVFVREFIENF